MPPEKQQAASSKQQARILWVQALLPGRVDSDYLGRNGFQQVSKHGGVILTSDF
jgi:hypothetical protein